MFDFGIISYICNLILVFVGPETHLKMFSDTIRAGYTNSQPDLTAELHLREKPSENLPLEPPPGLKCIKLEGEPRNSLLAASPSPGTTEIDKIILFG